MTATPYAPLLAWLAMLDETDRMTFYEDLAVAVATAHASDDASRVEECLRQWRLTAESIVNAGLRDQLLETSPPTRGR